jgi:hypothetical protein
MNGEKTRFSKENQPENRGRKHGSLSAKTILNKYLAIIRDAENPITGQQENLTVAEEIQLQQIKKALIGDKDAYNNVMDRTEGKAQTNIKMDADVTQRTVHVGFSDEVEEENEDDND